MDKNNKLQVILNEQGIDKSDVGKLVEAFGGPFEEAGQVLATYKEIEVTDVKDVAGMQKAREARLLLKKARTTVENKRKELKADIVKQGKAIDSVARFVKEEIEPAEEYLELQEKFAEIKHAEEQARIKAERVEKLMQYTDDISLYNLDAMTDEQFNSLLATLKAQHEAEEQRKLDEAKAAEEARKAEEKRIADQAKENARLKKEAEAREAEQAKKDAEAKAEQDRIKAEADAKIEAERKKTEALEQEKREREEADRKAQEEKERAEREAKEAEEAKEREALLAPDKDKLIAFADQLIKIELPMVKSKQARDILAQIETAVTNLSNGIKNKAKEL